MPRVPVPDDYERGVVLVAGEKDFHYDGADVQVSDDRARTLHVREDEDGRYVGPPSQYVDEVAEFLGVDVDTEVPGEGETTYEDRPAAAIEAGECPWCDDYSGDGVPQHASSAHEEEWSAYKEATE